MDGFHLLTFHGTVVCLHARDGRLVHRPLSEMSAECAPACWRFTGGASLALLPDGIAADGWAPPAPGFAIRQSARRAGAIHLFRGSAHVRATPDGTLDGDAEHPQAWEEFLIVSEAELRRLAHLAGNAWIVARTRQTIPPADIAVLPDFQVRVGPITASLTPTMPLLAEDTAHPAKAMLVFYDGWKVEELRLFRPLIYFTVMRRQAGEAAYLKMALLSIFSFLVHNDVPADFLLITNADADEIRRDVPEGLQSRVHVSVLEMPGTNIIDVFLQRYRIGEWERSARYQPLLYLDADVVFNNDVSEFLRDLALSPSIMVGEEFWSPLPETASVGGQLFDEDRFDLPVSHGFNSGVIGIPQVAPHRLHLQAICEVIQRYAALRGREALGWFDQACANYVSAKIAPFDRGPVTRVVEHIWSDDQRPQLRSGLVHFWGSRNKPVAMEAYIMELHATGGGRTRGV